MSTEAKAGVAVERTEPYCLDLAAGSEAGSDCKRLGSGCFEGRLAPDAKELALPRVDSPRCLAPALLVAARSSGTRRYRRETARVIRIRQAGGGSQGQVYPRTRLSTPVRGRFSGIIGRANPSVCPQTCRPVRLHSRVSPRQRPNYRGCHQIPAHGPASPAARLLDGR
jgi:hypothetical protein